MPAESENTRPKAGRYQTKKHRWPTRILVAALSVAGMLGLWQFVANEPAAAQNTPSMQDAEQQLQLSNNSGDGSAGWFSNQNAPSAPNVISGQS